MAFKTFSVGAFGKIFTLWHIFSGLFVAVYPIGQLIGGGIITYIRVFGRKLRSLRHFTFLILQAIGGDDEREIDK